MSTSAPLETDGTTLAFESTLDAGGALQACRLLEHAPARRIVLDFSRVRNADYFALATLVVALARQPPGRVRLHGLCEQHTRLMRHLGVDVDRILRRQRADEDADGGDPLPAALAASASAGAPGARDAWRSGASAPAT